MKRLLCLVGRHHLTRFRMRAVGETWWTCISYCDRCNRVKGPSHAERETCNK